MRRSAAALTIASLSSLTLATAILPTPVRAQQITTETLADALNGIVVQGTGEIQATPDIARLSVGVVTQGREASGVAQDNATKTTALIQALKAVGVAEKDIRTVDYSISPQYDYTNQNNGKPPTIAGYQAMNQVEVTIRKIADAGKVIDAAAKAGGNTAGGLSFDLNDDSRAAAADAALAKAVAQAKHKAEVMAKAAGANNLRLIGIQEETSAPPIVRPMYKSATMAAGAAPTTPVQAGQQTVSVTVTLRYRILS